MRAQLFTNMSYVTPSGANHYMQMGGGSPSSSSNSRLTVMNTGSSGSPALTYSITASNSLNSSGARTINASATGAGTAGYFSNGSTSGFAGYFAGRVYASDRIGVGTTSPNVRLELSNNGGSGTGPNVMLRLTNQYNPSGNNLPTIQFHNGATTNPAFWQIGARVAGTAEMLFTYKFGTTSENTIMSMDGGNGKVRIGDVSAADNDYLLFVEKGIATGKVFVSSSYADYVFLPDYHLPSLEEVRGHIAQAGHLPNMPSQAEIDAAGGFEVGAIAVKQMEKIEELYLYVLQLHDRIAEWEAQLTEKQQHNENHK
ncbi:MAG: hypothetical protein OHK0039_31890 [Bacteroidia bacterium]